MVEIEASHSSSIALFEMKQLMSLSERYCSVLETNPTVDLMSLLRDLSSEFGFDNITYYAPAIPTGEGDEAVLITTYPQGWIAHYFNRKYQTIDPVLFAGSNSLLPVYWSGLAAGDDVAAKFFGEAIEFGIGKVGLTVPVRGLYGEQALLSLNSGCAENDWKAFCQEMASDIHYLAHLIHEKVIVSRCQHVNCKRPSLTRREAEVLRWAARGKTVWETAMILGLSEKTVTFYLGNVYSKLRVATKTQAVAKAMRGRLILF